MLDTNICIYLINNKTPRILRRFQDYAPGDIAISSISVSELSYGVSKSRQRQKNARALERFLLPLEIVEYGAEAAAVYGVVRAGLEKKGRPIGPLDMLIAAHALSLGLVLVTNNVREFREVEKLKLENWAE